VIRYSFVVPIFRDGELAADFCAEFERVFKTYVGADSILGMVELIFVNDDGSHATADRLRATCDRYPFARAINLSRNFGQHIALSCGYRYARGEYVGSLNVDMEDPPDHIPLLLEPLEQGRCDVTFGLRSERKSPFLVRVTSLGFNYVLNKAMRSDVPLNLATLRVMNRQFVDAYNVLSEKSRYIPGLEIWLGFQRCYVEVAHEARRAGKSSYTMRRRLRMAFEAIISLSDVPLRITVGFGLAAAMVGFALSLYLVVGKLFFIDFKAGYTSTMSAIVLVGGVQILLLGVASLYIGRILAEVQNRPLYVVRSTYNVDRHV
jgi:glycosyltransferase involved in cell wall biosynthesis